MRYVLYIPNTNATKIKGIVLYYHPTVFGKLDIPTNTPHQINAIAGLYVTSGFAVLFPNYLGY